MKMNLEQADLENFNELEKLYFESKKNNEFDKAEKAMLEAWKILPEPKYSYSESYHIVRYLINIYIQNGHIDQASKWKEIVLLTAPHRKDTGEKEYMAGKIAYEAGNFNKAKRLFQLVQDKSKGRIFRDGDVKYFTFFKKK